MFSLFDDKGDLLHRFAVEGLAIGDDFNLDLTFPPISDSKGKYFTLRIDAPTEVKVGEEIILPYDQNVNDDKLSVNNEAFKGKLAYFTYYKVGDYWSNVRFSLNNIIQKL